MNSFPCNLAGFWSNNPPAHRCQPQFNLPGIIFPSPSKEAVSPWRRSFFLFRSFSALLDVGDCLVFVNKLPGRLNSNYAHILRGLGAVAGGWMAFGGLLAAISLIGCSLCQVYIHIRLAFCLWIRPKPLIHCVPAECVSWPHPGLSSLAALTCRNISSLFWHYSPGAAYCFSWKWQRQWQQIRGLCP